MGKRNSTAAHLWPAALQRTYTPVGHTYHPPKPCADCGAMVRDGFGQKRGDVFRCGKCDIAYCESCR